GRKGEYRDLFAKLSRKGYVRVRIDGKIYSLDDPPTLARYKKHTIEIVVDRIINRSGIRKRVADSVEIALSEGEGLVSVLVDDEVRQFSQHLACIDCGISYEEISPRMFSFNSPYGACPKCDGLGTKMEIDPQKVIINPELSIPEGAIGPWGEPSRWTMMLLEALSRHYHFDLDTPYKDLPDHIKEIILYGSEEPIRVSYTRRDGTGHGVFEEYFEGVIPNQMRRYRETESTVIRQEIERYMTISPCPACKGARLRPESLAIKIKGKNIYELTRLSIKEVSDFFLKLKLTGREEKIAGELCKEILKRLSFLSQVGLDYLTLDRTTESLSAGEEQRVRLANQIGSGLVGVLYILDEPSIGLHPRDNHRLLSTLKKLRDLGNTVIVVEHDADAIRSSDYVIDLGPGAGDDGGRVVATGTPEEITRNRRSLTGKYLAGKKRIEPPKHRLRPDGRYLIIKKASEHNLKSIDVRIPLGLFVCITGVSGSGKSTLVDDILYRALCRHFYQSRTRPGKHEGIIGLEHIDKVINIDQSPIGRTPRSNPATYTSSFTPIRELFAQLPEARLRGYKPGRFSFNVRGGRCEACQGDGMIKIEMHFLPDIYITCDACKGRRFNRETLEVKYKGYSIADVLNMSVDQAYQLFEKIPRIQRKLKLLKDVGLGYIKLGQSATTLSGGEAQRVKLARELSKVATGRTLYILDEPTTGLHYEDVRLLLNVLRRLVERGNTVLVIEHNLEVIKCADWIIDLGPEGGDEGGEIVAEGPPEEICRNPRSYTGRFLKGVL
ncbi:excinuclease ABC subunit UvrA, partial [candidate division WOR-3 bacterium]